MERDFSTLSPIIKCHNCQGYEYVAANCPTSSKIPIIDRVFIEAPKPDSTISPKATPVMKEFSVASPAFMTIVPFVATTTIIRPFSSPALLLTQHSLLSLLLTSTVIVCLVVNVSPLLPTHSSMIMELIDVLSEDLPGKLPLMHDTQQAIELVLRLSLPDLLKVHLEGVNRCSVNLMQNLKLLY